MSKDVKKKFDIADDLIEELKYKEAFEIFKSIVMDSKNSPSERADAYAGMGELIECCDPGLAPGDDESGLEYYKEALLLDNNNFDALLGVVRSFGEFFPYHQDTTAFKSAYHKLISHKSVWDHPELGHAFLERLHEQYALMQKMEGEK